MEQNFLYRTLFLMDDTRNYTNEFYISEFVKIVLYNEGCFPLSLEGMSKKITDLTSLEYTEDEILHALSIWNNGEVDIEDDMYMLSSKGTERISKKKKSSDLKRYIDLFLKENIGKYNISKNELEELLESFVYQRFNENLKEISDILNNCLTVDDYDKNYTYEEKIIINDFLVWNNDDKNESIYRLIAKAYDYCMINTKCQAQDMVFSKIHFYLDTNIIFRLMGINGGERESPVKTLIEKCHAAGVKIVVSNFVVEECEATINSQIELLIESTKMMNQLVPPLTMSFAEEKSIKLDFYSRYYDWVKAGNKHRNYDGFKKYVIKGFKELLESFEEDNNNASFKVFSSNDFKKYYDSLYDSKMDKHTTETDVNSVMLVLEKRKNTENGNEFFLISADQRLVCWSREIFPGQKSYVDLPSVWLSIILKYFGREKDTDYKAFCQFIHLSIEPQIDDLEKKIEFKSSIMATDIDDKIKTMMIDEVRENYNIYKDYEPEEVVRVTYAKSKEVIETEVKMKKEVEIAERLAEVEKGFLKYFDEQKQEMDAIKQETHQAIIDAYQRGQQDGIDGFKNNLIEKAINDVVKRNTFLRKLIKGIMWVLWISTVTSIIILIVLGYLKPKTKISEFFDEYGLGITILQAVISMGLSGINIKNVVETILPLNEEIIAKKLNKSRRFRKYRISL